MDETTNIDSDRYNVDCVDKKPSSQSEPYARNQPIEKLLDNLIEDEDEDHENRELDGEYQDVEISNLFQDAIVKLEKIKAYANQQKKQVVIELAKNLEGKIATDTICMEIVTQLRGQVSDGFVRECLDEKYKQKHRIVNARKQKKKQDYLEEKDAIDKLAEVTPLNSEPENGKIILVEATGQSVVERKGDNNYKKLPAMDNDDNSSKDNDEPPLSKLLNQKEHKQQLGPKYEPVDQSECSGCIELSSRILDLEGALKQNQFISADKMIIDFEFCRPYKDINTYIKSLQQYGDSADVWFSGKIDTSTGMIVSSGYGRIRQHKEQEPNESESIDNDEDWEDVV